METDNDEYFCSYEDLESHQIMLNDVARQEAYKKAILGNSELFQGKVVLDVGAGTGILSIFAARAGAAKVYAVEASNLVNLAREIIKDNSYKNIIQVVHKRIEDFSLPDEEKVDIIISEWMGFYLLHEGMLDSVLFARDRFLKEDGHMFPDKAILYLSPCSVPSRFDVYENLSGVNMTKFAEQLRLQKSQGPEIMNVASKDLLSDDTVVVFLDLKDMSISDLNLIEVKEVVVVRKPGKFQGLCLWFECLFPVDDEDPISETVTLSTHPKELSTHWKQTVILLPSEACEDLDYGDPIAFSLVIKRDDQNPRRYNLQFELLEAEKEEHSLPCDCIMTKCILTKAHLEKMEMEQI